MAVILLIVAAALGFVVAMYSALFLVAFVAPTMGYEAALPVLLVAGCAGAAVAASLLRRYQRRRRGGALSQETPPR